MWGCEDGVFRNRGWIEIVPGVRNYDSTLLGFLVFCFACIHFRYNALGAYELDTMINLRIIMRRECQEKNEMGMLIVIGDATDGLIDADRCLLLLGTENGQKQTDTALSIINSTL